MHTVHAFTVTGRHGYYSPTESRINVLGLVIPLSVCGTKSLMYNPRSCLESETFRFFLKKGNYVECLLALLLVKQI